MNLCGSEFFNSLENTWPSLKDPFLPLIKKNKIFFFFLSTVLIIFDIIGRFRICLPFKKSQQICRNISNTYFCSSQLFCMNQNHATTHIFANTQKSIPKAINKPNQGFWTLSPLFLRFHHKKKCNSNLNYMEQLLFTNFYPQMNFIFHLYCIKSRVFRRKIVKSTKMPIPMQFFHWNHRSRYTYYVLNLFWHLGICFFWVLDKMWEVAWFWFIQNKCFYGSVGISKKVNKSYIGQVYPKLWLKTVDQKMINFLYFFF